MFVEGGSFRAHASGRGKTQHVIMAMYALATVPLIDKVKTNGLRQVWYADDAAGGRKLASLRQWWNNLSSLGPKFGYLPNYCKSWLIVKPERFKEAKRNFVARM